MSRRRNGLLCVAVVAVVVLRVRVVGDGVRRWGICSGRGGVVGLSRFTKKAGRSYPVVSEKGWEGCTLPVRCQSRQHKKKKKTDCHCLRVAIVIVRRVRVVGDGVRRWGVCSGRGGEVGKDWT